MLYILNIRAKKSLQDDILLVSVAPLVSELERKYRAQLISPPPVNWINFQLDLFFNFFLRVGKLKI